MNNRRNSSNRKDNRNKPMGQKKIRKKREGSREGVGQEDRNRNDFRNKPTGQRNFRDKREDSREGSGQEEPRRNFKKYDPNKKFQKRVKPYKESTDTRLNKFIANAGICSRREADVFIAAGNVQVNGEVVTQMGYKVQPSDEVRFDGRVIKSEKKEYILLNKPKGFITTTADEKGRKTVMDLVANATKARVVPVGRLDRPTTGLLLLTNDGDLAKKLTHPSHEVRKIYHAILDKKLALSDLRKIEEGLELEDGPIQVDEISYIDNAPKNEIGIKIHSGRNRIVRRIFEHLGYQVEKLDRVVFAGLTKKDLPRGHWRHLTAQEVINLKNIK